MQKVQLKNILIRNKEIMKRLLLPLIAALALPTAVNAFPWNSDIVVKTDLGEKYIVKESAVTVSTFSWDNEVNKIEEFIKDKREYFDSCRSLKYFTEGDCRHWLSDEETYKNKLDFAKAWRDKPTSVVLVRFRPIFIDLNNKKIAKDYTSNYCLNPNLSKSDEEEILFASDIYSFPNKNSPTALGVTRYKVCEKYAKF